MSLTLIAIGFALFLWWFSTGAILFRQAAHEPALPATALTFATGCWIERAYAAPAGSGAEAGFVLLATLTALALVEHWLMILPVRDAALWKWMTPKRTGADQPAPRPAD